MKLRRGNLTTKGGKNCKIRKKKNYWEQNKNKNKTLPQKESSGSDLILPR